ncbi:MAG TPA: DNA recombination protein RmuC [Gammaproteobacteria bacterium]|jgi:DNA recombination protein RmuC|nr:DNA recombination protein RmuC [Gammaproteobacteria bacterium]
MPAELLLILIPALASAAVFGALLAFLFFSGKISRLRNENAKLEISLELERKATDVQYQSMQQMNKQLKDSFNALASEALQSNNSQFLRLAKENLEQFHIKAEGELEKREKAVENMVKPIREALDKTESQVRKMENERLQAHGALTRHLETMAESHRTLQNETRNLVQALRRPEVRGQWGELTLKRLAELAGMVEHCDFTEQDTVKTDAGNRRPDMVIRMPDRREIVVDAKTPLDAYLSAVESSSDDERKNHLTRHARNVRSRIKELSAKAYWEQLKYSPEFVVLFIPGDQFLSAALEIDHSLIEDALAQNVILATPTSLVALLRAIAYGWRQEVLAENADIIREIGQEMFTRLTTFAEHLAKLGRSLDNSVSAYNKAVSSYDSRVLPGARKFTELGISTKKEPPKLEQVERMARQVESREDNDTTH